METIETQAVESVHLRTGEQTHALSPERAQEAGNRHRGTGGAHPFPGVDPEFGRHRTNQKGQEDRQV